MVTRRELTLRNADMDGQARVAEASRPRLEDAAPFQPMFEAFANQMMQGFQMLAPQQAQASEQMSASLNAGLAQIAQIVAAPKDIKVQRDRNGKVSGATATPLLRA